MSVVGDSAIAFICIELTLLLGPQLGSVRLPPASLLSTYHLHAAFVRQAQGVVTLTAYEYEPGAGSAVESAFGGRCIQVGYVCLILMKLPTLKSQTSISRALVGWLLRRTCSQSRQFED